MGNKTSLKRRIVMVCLGIMLLLSLGFFMYFSYQVIQFQKQNHVEVQRIGNTQIELALQTVKKLFQQPVLAAHDLAKVVEKHEFSKPEQDLEKIAQHYPDLFGLGVAYFPYQYQKNLQLFAPYLIQESKNKYRYIDIAKVYDYTLVTKDPDTVWYHLPQKVGATWHEPYYGTASKAFLALYSLPVFNPDKTLYAMVIASYSIHNLQEILNVLDIGKSGYAVIFSSKGTILAHPDANAQNQNLVEYAVDNNRLVFAELGKKIIQNKNTETFAVDSSGQEKFVITRELGDSPWIMGLILDVNELMSYRAHEKQIFIKGIIFSSATILILLFVIWAYYRPNAFSLHSLSIGISAIFVGTAIAYIANSQTNLDVNETKIFTQSSLNQYIQSSILLKYKGQDFITIPTGIYLKSINFIDNGRIELSGFMWQKIPKTADINKTAGTTFPQQTTETHYKKLYEKPDSQMHLIGWQFDTVLNVQYNNRQYPFGRNLLDIKIIPKNLGENIILAPDLAAYEDIKPSTLPGIQPHLHLKNWLIIESYFSYTPSITTADLGMDSYSSKLPELSFNVIMENRMISPLITFVIPLGIISLLNYLALFRDQDKQNVFLRILGYSASLLFILALLHIALRETILSMDITFAEYCYIIMYIMICLVTLNELLLAKNVHIRFVEYHHNLLSQLMYWPLFTGFILFTALLLF